MSGNRPTWLTILLGLVLLPFVVILHGVLLLFGNPGASRDTPLLSSLGLCMIGGPLVSWAIWSQPAGWWLGVPVGAGVVVFLVGAVLEQRQARGGNDPPKKAG